MVHGRLAKVLAAGGAVPGRALSPGGAARWSTRALSCL